MKLGQLLKDVLDEPLYVSCRDWDITGLSCDSRTIEPNSVFVALSGARFKGVDFIREAIAKGARVVISNLPQIPVETKEQVCFICVKDPFKALKGVVRNFFQNPSRKIKTIGVTGTNGKTTITYLVESILQRARKTCGVIGTINYRLKGKAIPSINTTPGLLDNQRILTMWVQEGVDYAVMEVSSHALDQGRVDLIDFKTAVFTNLTREHLDYHKTMEAYFLAKARLFTNLASDSLAVVNLDDPYGQRLAPKIKSRLLTYALQENADIYAREIQMDPSGTRFKLYSPGGDILIHTQLIGVHNVVNILAAAAVGIGEGLRLAEIKEGIENLTLVPGRLERVDFAQDYSILIDYAHTPDALEKVLKNLREICQARLILVFGCGGDRDKTKRPLMGGLASQLADFSVVTSDNPRGEDPQSIIAEILPGFKKNNFTVKLERQEAMRYALQLARPGDIVLIAGKGHETYQIFKDKTIPFNERETIGQILAAQRKCLSH